MCPRNWESTHDAMRRLNPSLIYCSVTGFGASGDLKNWAAYDHIVQAMSGIMWMNGEPTQGPLKVGIPFADTFSGYLAAFAIMTALFQRSRSGAGQFIDVGMLDATMVLLSQAVASYQLSGKMPIRTGNRGYRLTATADTYETRDGYLSIGANHQHQFEALCRCLGRAELLEDPRFEDFQNREENREALRKIIADLLLEQSAQDLEKVLADAGVPVAKVRTVPETLAHSQMRSRDLFVRASIPGRKESVQLTGSGFRFSDDVCLGAKPLCRKSVSTLM